MEAYIYLKTMSIWEYLGLYLTIPRRALNKSEGTWRRNCHAVRETCACVVNLGLQTDKIKFYPGSWTWENLTSGRTRRERTYHSSYLGFRAGRWWDWRSVNLFSSWRLGVKTWFGLQHLGRIRTKEPAKTVVVFFLTKLNYFAWDTKVIGLCQGSRQGYWLLFVVWKY